MFSSKSSQTGLGRRMLVLLLAIVMLAGVMGVPAAADDTADGYDAAPEAIAEETTEETAEETTEETPEEVTAEEPAEKAPAGEPAEQSALPETGSDTDELPLDGEQLSIGNYRSNKSVWWDATDGAKGRGANAGVSAVTLSDSSSNNVAIGNADSNVASGLPAGVSVGSLFGPSPSANTSRTLTITAAAGYYVTNLVVACVPKSGVIPYKCSTWLANNAHTAEFTLSNSSLVNGSYTLTTSLSALAFCHDSNTNYDGSLGYFILIKVAPVPTPLYVEYDAALPFTASAGSVFAGSAWLSANAGNSYGSGSVLTANTQFEYSYTNQSEVASWKHFAGALSETALAEAQAAGWEFDGWKATWYNDCTLSGSTLTFSRVNSIGDSHIAAGSQVALPTHVRLVAQWNPIEQPTLGSLRFTKIVEGLPEGNSSEITYSFRLLKDNLGATLEKVQDFTLTITGNGSKDITFTDLEPGQYYVQEFAVSDLTLSDGQYYCTTTSPVNGAVTAGGTAELSITNNYYKYLPELVSVSVTKKLAGEGIPVANDRYFFELTAKDNAPLPADASNGTATVSIVHEGSTFFSPIVFDREGVYVYELRETPGSDPDPLCDYDSTVYTVTITVTGTGTAERHILAAATDITKPGENDAPVSVKKAEFTNTYREDKYITVTKSFIGVTKEDIPADFSITVKAPDNTVYTLRKDDSYFEDITVPNGSPVWKWTLPSGGGKYDVSESNAEIDDYTLSATGFGRSIEVANQGSLLLSNSYSVPTVNVTIRKVLSGGTSDGTFSIEWDVDGLLGDTSDIKAGEAIAINVPIGATLTVKEHLGSGSGYTTTIGYDGTTVSGTEAVFTITDTKDQTVTVTNTFKPAAVTLPQIEKKITGDAPEKAETYTFRLTAKDNAPLPADSTVTITGSGKASFPAVTFTKAGTYRYEIEEVKGSDKNCTYDKTVYKIDVIVTAKDDGTLSAEMSVTAGGKAADAVVFTNHYTQPTQPKNGGKTPPSTGDNSRPLLWLALAILAAAALSGTAVYLRRKKNGSR